MTHYLSRIAFIVAAAVALAPRLAWAQDGIDSGDTAWMLTSSVLVLFMTIPGLSLFYAGLVRFEERAVGDDAVLRDHVHGHDSMDGLRLRAGVR